MLRVRGHAITLPCLMITVITGFWMMRFKTSAGGSLFSATCTAMGRLCRAPGSCTCAIYILGLSATDESPDAYTRLGWLPPRRETTRLREFKIVFLSRGAAGIAARYEMAI